VLESGDHVEERGGAEVEERRGEGGDLEPDGGPGGVFDGAREDAVVFEDVCGFEHSWCSVWGAGEGG